MNLDLLRCFKIIHNFKINKLNCVIIPPKNPLISPWFLTFKQLEDWTRSYIKLSYVEYILHFPCIKEGSVFSAFNNITGKSYGPMFKIINGKTTVFGKPINVKPHNLIGKKEGSKITISGQSFIIKDIQQ